MDHISELAEGLNECIIYGHEVPMLISYIDKLLNPLGTPIQRGCSSENETETDLLLLKVNQYLSGFDAITDIKIKLNFHELQDFITSIPNLENQFSNNVPREIEAINSRFTQKYNSIAHEISKLFQNLNL